MISSKFMVQIIDRMNRESDDFRLTIEELEEERVIYNELKMKDNLIKLRVIADEIAASMSYDEIFNEKKKIYNI